jgi:hypothetical protein
MVHDKMVTIRYIRRQYFRRGLPRGDCAWNGDKLRRMAEVAEGIGMKALEYRTSSLVTRSIDKLLARIPSGDTARIVYAGRQHIDHLEPRKNRQILDLYELY